MSIEGSAMLFLIAYYCYIVVKWENEADNMISTLYIDHQLTCTVNSGISQPVVCVIYVRSPF